MSDPFDQDPIAWDKVAEQEAARRLTEQNKTLDTMSTQQEEELEDGEIREDPEEMQGVEVSRSSQYGSGAGDDQAGSSFQHDTSTSLTQQVPLPISEVYYPLSQD